MKPMIAIKHGEATRTFIVDVFAVSLEAAQLHAHRLVDTGVFGDPERGIVIWFDAQPGEEIAEAERPDLALAWRITHKGIFRSTATRARMFRLLTVVIEAALNVGFGEWAISSARL